MRTEGGFAVMRNLVCCRGPYLMTFPLLLSLGGCGAKKEPPRVKPAAPVSVATSMRKDVPVEVRAIGNVEAFNAVAIKAQVNGQIAQVHFTEGQDVRKGQVLFTIDPRLFQAAVRQAEAVLAKDFAQAKFSQEQVRRYGSLVKDGIVAQDQYDQLKSNAEAYDAIIAADRAAVENAKLQLAYCTIRSPIDGRTGNLAVKLGNLVKANDDPVLVTINQISPVYATFSLPERDLTDIKRYLAAGTLKVEAMIPNDGNGSETGSISFLDNAVDIATGTIKLKGKFTNSSRRLWPGQYVNVVLTLTTLPGVTIVPQQAVQTGQQGQFLFVVKPDSTVEVRPVVAGRSYQGAAIIEKGVQPGETVVTDGQMRLSQGAKVEVRR